MGNSPSKVTQQDKAILQVKLQRDKLTNYQKSMEYNMTQQRSLIKNQLIKGDRTGAKLLLKRLKYQEKLSDQVNDQLMNLENMIRTIEFKLIEKDFISGLSQGNDMLKKLNGELRLDEVEDLMDDVRENIAYQEEIDAVLSGSVIGKDYEDEIDEELEALEREEAIKKGDGELKLPSVDGLPDIKPIEDDRVENKPVVSKKPVKEEYGRTALLA